MIKFKMKFFDVLFPINLGPLSYRCPNELQRIIEPGIIVSAPLKNKIAKGVVIGISTLAPKGDIKDIQKVHSDLPKLSNSLITLLKWMSEYYLVEKGIVLKNMLPRESFTKPKKRKTKISTHPPLINGGSGDYIIDINNNELTCVLSSIYKKRYRTFLLHAPSSIYEYSFIIKILSDTGNAIILIPEVSQIGTIYSLLKEQFGERVCLLYGGLSKGKRSEAIQKIISGTSDIVVGTRSAIFAPLKNVSFIAVLHEHSSSYKQWEGLCYNGRDVAVMRGFLEKAVVLLTSISPSIESFYNSKVGKYTLIKPEGYIKDTKVRVLDMKSEKTFKPYLSKTIIDAAKRYIQNNKKVIFLINRRGHSTLLQCKECNYVEGCPLCKIPLVIHKTLTENGLNSSLLRCHYCGYISIVPEMCSRCKGYYLELHGAGAQRVQEDIENLLGIKTLRLDSDVSRKKSETEKLLNATHMNEFKIIIGTKFMARRLHPDSGSSGFSMAAILNPDHFINLPDFRATEKAFQEITSIIDKIEPSGEIFIQTKIPNHYLYKCFKKHDYNKFFKEELSRRKPLNYPPFSRLLLMKFISKRDIYKELEGIISKTKENLLHYPSLVNYDPSKENGDYKMKRIDDKVQILGPSTSKNIKGKYEFKILLKSSVRGALHEVARNLIEALKDSKDVKIKVDVDPISI
ncbi:MAG: replication restart helicase PriA [Thermodesulfovibrionales bacterium]